jgi:hypothetical protein
MTIKIDSIKNDVETEVAGEYIDIPEWPGVSLGVRATTYPPYQLALDVLVQEFQRKYKGKNAPPAVRDERVGKLLAQHILYGWKGFDQPYSVEFATELMGSPAGANLVKQTIWASGQVGETEIEFVKVTTKNSVTPSDTN